MSSREKKIHMRVRHKHTRARARARVFFRSLSLSLSLSYIRYSFSAVFQNNQKNNLSNFELNIYLCFELNWRVYYVIIIIIISSSMLSLSLSLCTKHALMLMLLFMKHCVVGSWVKVESGEPEPWFGQVSLYIIY